MPDSADEAVGELALNQIDGSGLMQPSTLSPREQQAMRDAFEQSVARLTVADVPRHHLEFRKSGIGPNAFALPGGTIVLTDELYRRMDGDRDILVGVLRANRISPRVMAQFFVKVRQPRPGEQAGSGVRLPIAFASHPADEERIRYFEQAAGDGR